ncbi:phage holin, LLH family [Tumebacillus permanentifrigoris]|uniref:Superfamily 6 holin (LLH) n=1 Tax=Tumebacillus permanentifrigoris TaxID=378543 RepID=A0A316D9Q0_9BACL|nr:phage holin, LLH family [Tumebacillus permanentifrigoris]PWK13898.1 superfamily 6 holin (LLH) [Tumebacillus permanentifrigoris]
MTDSWMSLVQQGTTVLVQIAVLVVIILVRTVKKRLETYYTSHTTVQQRQLLSQFGREAFAYAETVYRDYDGPAKMNEAIKYLLDTGESAGMKDIPLTSARAVIESAWLDDKRKTS